MIKFGSLKSKIDKKLLESYSTNTFKNEMKIFKKLVLENKSINKLFFLYDDLSSNKGLNESLVNDYIHECITIYENVINKLDEKSFDELRKWTKNIESENQYSNIDNLFSNNVLTIESRIQSKKLISENLIKSPNKKSEVVNLPISTMVNVANKTLNNYIESLNESDKKELINFLKSDDSELQNNFEQLRESVKNKLTVIKETTNDSETLNRVEETINKVESEKYDKFTYFKLKSLNENL